MAGLILRTVTKRFADAAAPAVDAVSLDVAHGEFLAILGPSGCGKTTLLRLVAGFERPGAGEIRLGDRLVADGRTHVPPEDRHVGIVFQSYALWPHMTVGENVGYPLRTRGVRGAEYRSRVAAALDVVGLGSAVDRRPASLSGGQRQRVALARCLAMAPDLVLLDEPLANLDVHLKASLLDEFQEFRARTGATMLYITHDQSEAMALADRIAVMNQGRVEQVAAPETLYHAPATAFVADFIGRGGVVAATVPQRADQGRALIEIAGHRAFVRAVPEQAAGRALVCLRPEDLALADDGLPARCRRARYQGGEWLVDVTVEGQEGRPLQLLAKPGTVPEPGTPVRVRISDGWVIPG
ncbi:spermidine/putrescine ABC transporter ATP-binding protein [Aliidongia dinghuensis]|uniref:Spermidine/putrescine ABC transporter ATP-binding protein n=1 Tax=Aliidongia dinghuensis TaxID=1867774 RepID=A0A8J2YTZ4_9PROT|nr:ABC transporter ATP-binding protein [Aliidongia dinghuensis]GGF21632.1 spermidine/putrescine ABC transporter ATP-binding protein [Aliidongia dinghuensis]